MAYPTIMAEVKSVKFAANIRTNGTPALLITIPKSTCDILKLKPKQQVIVELTRSDLGVIYDDEKS